MFSAYLCMIFGQKMEGISLWWVSILSLSIIISDFILMTLIKSCFKLVQKLKPTNREKLKFQLEFNLRLEYIPYLFLFLLMSVLIKFGGFCFLYYNLITIHICFYIKLYKRNLSIKKKLNFPSSSNNVTNILDQTETYRNDFKVFFEYKNSTWHWYHYIYLIGCIFSWIGSLVFGFQYNLVWCKVFLTFVFLSAFQNGLKTKPSIHND